LVSAVEERLKCLGVLKWNRYACYYDADFTLFAPHFVRKTEHHPMHTSLVKPSSTSRNCFSGSHHLNLGQGLACPHAFGWRAGRAAAFRDISRRFQIKWRKRDHIPCSSIDESMGNPATLEAVPVNPEAPPAKQQFTGKPICLSMVSHICDACPFLESPHRLCVIDAGGGGAHCFPCRQPVKQPMISNQHCRELHHSHLCGGTPEVTPGDTSNTCRPSPDTQTVHDIFAEVTSIQTLLKFFLPTLAIWLIGPSLSMIDTAVVGSKSASQLAALGPGCILCDCNGYLFSFLAVASECFCRVPCLCRVSGHTSATWPLGATTGTGPGNPTLPYTLS